MLYVTSELGPLDSSRIPHPLLTEFRDPEHGKFGKAQVPRSVSGTTEESVCDRRNQAGNIHKNFISKSEPNL